MEINVLHIDDDPFELERIKKSLSEGGFEYRFNVVSVLNSDDYFMELSTGKFQVAILDIHLNQDGVDGVSLASKTRKKRPEMVVIMRSNMDDPAVILKCLKAGADDFLSKDSDKGELCLRVANSYKLARLKHGHQNKAKAGDLPSNIIGRTHQNIWSRVPRIIDSAISSIVVRGPSGAGKEVVANLFAAAMDPEVPFVAVNCGAIAPTLLESELFGHVKGAFTGAQKDKMGFIEHASGGWLFLDEVATLSSSAQVALLRVLESGEVIPVGASEVKKVFVRFIAATNENIEEMIEKGEFRGDLWQRLQEAVINLPPLSERLDELPALIDHFCQTMNGGPYTITKSAKDILVSYDWKHGNVRELRNCLRAMTEFHQDKQLTPLAIPENILESLDYTSSDAVDTIEFAGQEGIKSITTQIDLSSRVQFDEVIEGMMMQVIQMFLDENPKLSLRGLSQLIGISRSTLSTKIKEALRKGKPEYKSIEKAFNFG